MKNDTPILPFRQSETIADPLTELAREGARRMLAEALKAEADAFVTSFANEQLEDGRQRIGICWIIDRGPQSELHTLLFKLIGDGAGIRNGSGQPIQLRHDQSVAIPHGGKGLIQAGACAVCAGQTVVCVDEVFRDTQFQKRLSLG